MNAHLTAALAVLDEMYGDLIDAIRQSEEDVLNWTPPIAGVNSIAALTRHIAASNDAWFRRALNEPVQRNRDAEFQYQGNAEALIDILSDSRKRVREQAERLDEVDPAMLRRYTRLGDDHESALTVAWCIQHALVHTAEHWGQIRSTDS